MALTKDYPKEYNAWHNMKGRCRADPYYTTKGITVCEQWQDNFWQFLEDMGTHPGHGYSLDRIDNGGNYKPLNCRWATKSEQMQNTDKSIAKRRRLENKVVRKTYQQCIDESKIPNLTTRLVESRINRYGWSLERALTVPVCSTRGNGKIKGSSS
tara:strand:- start:51 stop:515 length:465 start_codon:yes stop_codon:yes gene_type:complete